MIDWIKSVIENEYRFINVIVKEKNKTVKIYENKNTKIKVIVKEFDGKCDVYEKLINIEHKNLPIIYEAFNKDDNSIVIEEYIDGVTIDEILETGLYTEDGTYEVVRQLCNALQILHKNNIIHRDIKPENVMITNEGCVKLIDFNIARIKKEVGEIDSLSNNISTNEKKVQNKDTRILGTIGYAAPEQFGISKTDEKTDIYSLGILINVMLTGEHPSKKICTGKWKKIVQKCTNINPNDRYKNVCEILK